jgi:hypothetical protein
MRDDFSIGMDRMNSLRIHAFLANDFYIGLSTVNATVLTNGSPVRIRDSDS